MADNPTEVHGPAIATASGYHVFCPTCGRVVGFGWAFHADAQSAAAAHNREAHPQPPSGPVNTMNDDDLAAEARAEAIRCGDPETRLVWDLANAIERLQADLATALLARDKWADDCCAVAREKSEIEDDLAAANTLLGEAADELAKHGWGDFHYGSQGQEPQVVEMVARIRARIEADPVTLEQETWAEGLGPDQLQPGQAPYVDPEPSNEPT